MSAINTQRAESVLLDIEHIVPTKHVPDLAEDVRAGLLAKRKILPPKYFYDEYGSQLFDQICDTPEYYPTRSEDALLAKHAENVIAVSRPDRILELGSGTSRKTRHLLDACEASQCRPTYAPFDVCREVLEDARHELVAEYDWLAVKALVGDYTAGLENLPRSDATSLIAFLGSTIGNFPGDEAIRFLREVRALMDADDRLLVGADRFKDPETLHAAYNDAAGLTAAFNLNLLEVINRELDANFDLAGFEHYAFFNPLESRIEMNLIATRDQTVDIPALDATVQFRDGDPILTEVSCKFTRASLQDLLSESGFAIQQHHEAAEQGFSLILARPV